MELPTVKKCPVCKKPNVTYGHIAGHAGYGVKKTMSDAAMKARKANAKHPRPRNK